LIWCRVCIPLLAITSLTLQASLAVKYGACGVDDYNLVRGVRLRRTPGNAASSYLFRRGACEIIYKSVRGLGGCGVDEELAKQAE
jgi:hypothetical protein